MTKRDYINFGNFSFDECLWAANCGVPKKIINNALNKSIILSEEQLTTYSLEHGNEKWKLFYRSGFLEFKFENLYKSLTEFSKQLLVFQFANNVTVALYVAKQCSNGITELEQNAIAYIFSNEIKKKRLLIKRGAEFPYSLSLNEVSN